MPETRKRRLLVITLVALLCVSALHGEISSPVRASLAAEAPTLRQGEVFIADIILEIEPGWHVYGPSSGASGTSVGLPTTVIWDLPPGFTALPPEWPRMERFSYGGIDSWGYSGTLLVRNGIRAPESFAAGAAVSLKAKVEWLACRVECMPGEASLELSLPVAAAAGPKATVPKGVGLAMALLLAFTGGLILNLMPCVLPVLSLKALSLAKSAGAGSGREAQALSPRGHVTASAKAQALSPAGAGHLSQGLYFTAGVLVSFWLFAGILLALRAGGQAAGWGFQLQDPVFVVAAAAVFFLVALNLFGVFEVGASLTRLGSVGKGRGDAASSFLSGLFTTAVATPCTAPFMGVAVGYALSHNAAVALGVFTALGLGMAAPLLAISAIPGLARRLPKAGAWMVTFRQILGFPMMAAVVWMTFVLAGLGGVSAVLSLLGGLLSAGMGAWVWGTWGRFDRSGRVKIVAAAFALALAAGGIAWSMGAAAHARADAIGRATGPKAASPGNEANNDGFWQPWSEDRLADLRSRGVPVFVDFTAAWCLSCQVNEAVALNDAALRSRFAELGVAPLKADWTAKDEAIGRALAALGRASVPVYALYPPGAASPILLPEVITPAIVLHYLDVNIASRR
jgi:thiol:disulfide interchange protein DsbD